MKQCCFCRQTLPLERFHRYSRTPDSCQYQCKDCDRLRVKAAQRAMAELRQQYPAQYLAMYEKHRTQLTAEVMQEAAS